MKKTKKEILISVDEYEIRVALLEDRRLIEYYAEEKEKRRIVGNIYSGIVKDVLPGMEAAFIDIGLERNAFLFVDEAIVGDGKQKRTPKIQQLLSPNQNILVQVIREPVEKKGARLSAQLSLPGRKLVLMPYGSSLGVSKKLDRDERERLHRILLELKPDDQGLIARTAAVGASEADLKEDFDYLKKLWHSLSKRNDKLSPPALLYTELDLASRTLRDIFGDEYHQLLIDDKEKYEDLITLVEKTSPHLKKNLKLHKGEVSLFDSYDIEAQLDTALSRKVWLKSGGYIAIDRTEALTSIDVNTAKNIGSKSLEETIYKNNLEAAEEIVRQLRLRDIGGIIVIDFIDMQEQQHRESVFSAFNSSLESDRTKSRVIEISKLGLVEMTRKSTSRGVQAYFYDKCPVCHGSGHTISVNRAALNVLRKIERAIKETSSDELQIVMAADLKAHLELAHSDSIKRLEEKYNKVLTIHGDERFLLTTIKVEKVGGEKEIKESMSSGNKR